MGRCFAVVAMAPSSWDDRSFEEAAAAEDRVSLARSSVRQRQRCLAASRAWGSGAWVILTVVISIHTN